MMRGLRTYYSFSIETLYLPCRAGVIGYIGIKQVSCQVPRPIEKVVASVLRRRRPHINVIRPS